MTACPATGPWPAAQWRRDSPHLLPCREAHAADRDAHPPHLLAAAPLATQLQECRDLLRGAMCAVSFDGAVADRRGNGPYQSLGNRLGTRRREWHPRPVRHPVVLEAIGNVPVL